MVGLPRARKGLYSSWDIMDNGYSNQHELSANSVIISTDLQLTDLTELHLPFLHKCQDFRRVPPGPAQITVLTSRHQCHLNDYELIVIIIQATLLRQCLHILIYSCLIKQSKILRGKLYRKSLCPHTSLHVNVGVVLFCGLLAFKVFIIFVYSLCVYVERSENNLWSQASLSSMQFLVLKHRL